MKRELLSAWSVNAHAPQASLLAPAVTETAGDQDVFVLVRFIDWIFTTLR